MTRIEFIVEGLPKGQPRPRAFYRKGLGVRCYDPGTAEGWKSSIAQAAKSFVPSQPIEGPIALYAYFTMPRPGGHYGKKGGQPYLKDKAPHYVTSKPDLDNLEKALMDCLTLLGFWHDDAQVCVKHSGKSYGHPGCRVVVEQTEEP